MNKVIHVDKRHAHCAMFIQLKTEEEENYLVYMYPDVVSSNIHAKSIEQLKGVFHAAFGGSIDILGAPLAYMHLVPSTDSSNDLASNSVLLSARQETHLSLKSSMNKLRLEMKRKENLIVAYRKIHDDLLFIFVLPHTQELFISNYMNCLYELLVFAYPSIDEILNDQSARLELDSLFNRFFAKILANTPRSLHFLETFSKSVPTFNCTFNLSQLINSELNKLESSFHSKDLVKTPHACFMLGSCLFHAGTLIETHLSPHLTKKIVLFLNCMDYLPIHQDHPESIIVQEIFYEEKENPFGLVQSLSEKNKKKNSFLLVILAQGRQVLCSVLELRLKATSQRDPYFIDEMRTCLQRMHSSDLFNILDYQMSDNRPPLAEPTSFTVRTRSSKAKSVHNLTVDQTNMDILLNATEGPYNVLFNYVVHSQARGSIIFPITLSDSLKKVSVQFVKYCEIIRQVLMIRRQHVLLGDDDYISEGDTGSAFMKHLALSEEQPCVEYGIRVEDCESFAPNSITYWVVGVMLPIDQESDSNLTEVYVCYEDSVPQNVVEVAYRLASSII